MARKGSTLDSFWRKHGSESTFFISFEKKTEGIKCY